jgi:hypothetical protein
MGQLRGAAAELELPTGVMPHSLKLHQVWLSSVNKPAGSKTFPDRRYQDQRPPSKLLYSCTLSPYLLTLLSSSFAFPYLE